MYKHTDVYRRHAHDLRAMALGLLDAKTLEWRHHGIGLLQAYLLYANPEVRLHIWHPDLLIPGMEKSGQIHDHRFLLVSTVLVGSITHTEFNLTPSPNGAWRKWTVLNARKALDARKALNASSGAEPPQPADDARYDAETFGMSIDQDEAYEFEAGEFHKSDVTELAVTLVIKRNQTERKAMILSPYDVTPVHAFDPNRQAVNVDKYLAMAKKALVFAASEASR